MEKNLTYQRIMIIGCGGSGKSTTAKRLGALSNLPVLHLDKHYWRPGWVEPDKATWEQQIRELIAEDRWVMDGNYGGTMNLRLARADLVIYLDMPTWLCLFRVMRRTLSNLGQSRVDMPQGCPEKWSWEFLHYILFFRQTRRPGILKRLRALENKSIRIIKSPAELNAFFKDWER